MTVYLVGAGPGDPGLLTRRGADLLARADVVVFDRLIDRSVLELAPPQAERLDVGKRPGGPTTLAPEGPGRQEEINRLLVEHGLAGRTVVRLKGGDPYVFGRGGEEAEALAAAGVPFEVVPGVSSAFAVPAAAGIPVTQRGVSASVTVVTGRVGDEGGDPAQRQPDWEALARAGGTLVIMMGAATRAQIARRLVAGGRPPDTPVAVVEWGTTAAQRVARTTLGHLGTLTVGSPAIVVVGQVAGLDLGTLDARPLAGRVVVVTRPRHQSAELVGALTEAGARVVELPTVEIADAPDGGVALGSAAGAAGTYDWLAFTSANAVERFVAAVPDLRRLARVRLAVVGAATATALAGHRLVADLVPPPARANAGGLVEVFPLVGSGGRVLYPRAEEGRDTLAGGLRARGWVVDEVVAYRTVPAPAPPDEVVAGVARADAVTFTSPSTARNFLALRTAGGQALPVPAVVACVGSVTAAAARKAGLTVTVEAAAPSAGALVEALTSALAGGGPGHEPGRR